MQLIAAHNGKILTLNAPSASAPDDGERLFSSGVPALDALAPMGGFARGAIHELLASPEDGHALFLAARLAAGACAPSAGRQVAQGRFIVWCDMERSLYPPALVGQGIRLDRLLLLGGSGLDPQGKDLKWAMAECLRCPGVGAVVADPGRLSRLEARRLQLAAETGGGVAILLRQLGRESLHHAAVSRWLVRPIPGSRAVQRWTIQLLHGHGGRFGQTIALEHCRETNSLHSFAPMADRSAASRPPVQRAS